MRSVLDLYNPLWYIDNISPLQSSFTVKHIPRTFVALWHPDSNMHKWRLNGLWCPKINRLQWSECENWDDMHKFRSRDLCFQDLVIQNLILVYMYTAMGKILKFYLRTMNGSAGSIGLKSWEIKKNNMVWKATVQ